MKYFPDGTNSKSEVEHGPQAHITSPCQTFFVPVVGLRYAIDLEQKDAIDEDGHDGSADQTGDGYGHKPRHEDVSEQTPVHSLP